MAIYPMVCSSGHALEVVAPITEGPGAVICQTCLGPMRQDYRAQRVAIAAAAMPNKKSAVVAIDAKDKQWDIDAPAYKRLRKQGYQPKDIEGSARLEAKAQTSKEIEMGRLLGPKAKAKVKEADQISQDLGVTR